MLNNFIIIIIIILIIIDISISFNFNIKNDNNNRLYTRKMKKIRLQQDDYIYVSPPASLPSDYVFTPPEVGWEIWSGSIIALLPIIWASFEFYSRIKVQQECLVCSGSGLVQITKSGTPLTRARKCWSCGIHYY